MVMTLRVRSSPKGRYVGGCAGDDENERLPSHPVEVPHGQDAAEGAPKNSFVSNFLLLVAEADGLACPALPCPAQKAHFLSNIVLGRNLLRPRVLLIQMMLRCPRKRSQTHTCHH